MDYALISLRIAIDRIELPHLTELSLDCHPAALLYLRPIPTFGGTPGRRRGLHQIKHLKLSIDSWPFDSSPTDHLKLLANYLRVFAGNVEKLTFHWYGERGPCPLTTPALSPATRVHGGSIQGEVRRKMRGEIWTSCSDEVLADTLQPPHLIL